VAPLSSQKQITAFSFQSITTATSTITEADKTIRIVLPIGSSLTGLTANVAVSPYATFGRGGTTTDFTGPVTYTVTAQDGSTVNYIVTVVVKPSFSSTSTVVSFYDNFSPMHPSDYISVNNTTLILKTANNTSNYSNGNWLFVFSTVPSSGVTVSRSQDSGATYSVITSRSVFSIAPADYPNNRLKVSANGEETVYTMVQGP
jgi:hypothetical protein